MSDATAKELLDLGSKLFSSKRPWDSLQQEIALNIYPERADFITPLILGQEFSAHLADSFPVFTRRELGNSLSAMLRPRDKDWFECSTGHDEIDHDPDVAPFLEYLTNCTREALYDARAKFIPATKVGDHDFISFGQCCISVEESPDRAHIYFRPIHNRDISFLENDVGEIDHLHRKDKMSSRALVRKFKKSELHQSILKAAEKEPDKEWPLHVVALPSDEYAMIGSGVGNDSKKSRLPYILVYLDVENEAVIREAPIAEFPYIVPRWHRVSGTQYAFSQSAMAALPDTRMSQALASIILEAGEKQINPPIVAREEVIRDASLQAGAITWADAEYDTPLKDHFMPVALNADMKTAFTMQQALRDTITKLFFVDKLALTESRPGMTAYEVAQRLEEHVRNLLPIFEPMETEYNSKILDKSFAVLRNMGHYDFSLMPEKLKSVKTPPTWRFINPMQEVSDRIRVQQFEEVLQLEQAAMQAGVATPRTDFAKARDAAVMQGVGAPADWFKSDEQVQQDAQQAEQEQQMQKLAGMVQQGAGAASQVADASQRIGQAMLPPGQAQPGQKALPAPKPARPAPRAA